MKGNKELNKKFDYKWVMVGLSFLMVFVALGFCSTSRSLYISPICDALGITRSAFSINDSCRYIATSVANLFFGTLALKLGLKKLVLAGFASLTISMILYAIGNKVYVFYIAGAFLGLGLAWTTTTIVGAVISRWCPDNQGTVMGFVLAANGLGGALAMQILSPIINMEGNPFGYRYSYALVAIILAVCGIIMAIFFKEKPKHQDPKVKVNKKVRGNIWTGIPFDTVLKKGYFYCAIVCIFFTGMVIQGMYGVAAPHLRDCGLDPAYVATVLSISSICLTLFKFLTGFIYDKYGLKITANTLLAASAVVLILLANVNNSASGKVIAMCYGVLIALAMPLETIMLPIYAHDLFGEKAYFNTMGIFSASCTAGFAFGAPLMNACYDFLGSYNNAFYVGFGLIIFVIILMQWVIHCSKKERKLVADAEMNNTESATEILQETK